MPVERKVLLVGIDPKVIDYSSGLLAGLSAELVMQVLEAGRAKFSAHGIEADMCLIDYGATANAVLTERLTANEYACVVVGAGVREPPETLVLFERVINLIHRLAPGAAIAFNSAPGDSVDAALRWLPAH
jgi:hypothetical protein